MTETLEEMCLRRWWEACVRKLRILPHSKRLQILASKAQKDLLLLTRCVLALIILVPCVHADVSDSIDDVNYTLKEHERHARIMEAVNDSASSLTPGVNENDHCSWAPVYDGNHPKMMKTETGYHAVYLKVCHDDPK